MTDSNRKPRMSLTEEQKTQALRLVKRMLAMGSYPSDIKTAIAGKYHLSRRSVERYMTRARHEMDECMDEDILQHRAESHQFYRDIIANEKRSVTERLHARKRLDKLLGLEIHRHDHQKSKPKLTAQQVQNMTDEELKDACKNQPIKSRETES
ncbi:hypothetical protein [uncultured Gimesia sp.]|uniref:hypothetical protein n=1 Tax=uncultured Gimesia sp. TaxID=1678688 RepID=UPI0030DD02E4